MRVFGTEDVVADDDFLNSKNTCQKMEKADIKQSFPFWQDIRFFLCSSFEKIFAGRLHISRGNLFVEPKPEGVTWRNWRTMSVTQWSSGEYLFFNIFWNFASIIRCTENKHVFRFSCRQLLIASTILATFK